MGPCIHTAQCILYPLCNHAFCRPTHLWAPPLQDMLSSFLDVCPTLQLVSALVCLLGVEQRYLETPSVGLLTSLFALLGYSKVLPESLMDSVTACSGTGIAYVSVCVHYVLCICVYVYTQMHKRKLCEEIKFIPHMYV